MTIISEKEVHGNWSATYEGRLDKEANLLEFAARRHQPPSFLQSTVSSAQCKPNRHPAYLLAVEEEDEGRSYTNSVLTGQLGA
jgi:hypothetical protein